MQFFSPAVSDKSLFASQPVGYIFVMPSAGTYKLFILLQVKCD